MKTCTIENCHSKHYGHGMCEKHYQRYRKRGTTEDAKGHHVVSLEEKLGRSTNKMEKCWEWTGLRRKGYGYVWWEGKMLRAHRAAWMVAYGPIQDGLLVLHHCDNASCVRPDHLYIGDHDDNMADKVARDRCAHLDRRGEKGGRTVLTAENVLFIRASPMMSKDLAVMFSVDRSTISDIRRRKSWTHI